MPSRSSSSSAVAVLLVALACRADAPVRVPAAAAEAPWTSGESVEGRFHLEWRPVPAPLPANEHFQLEVRLSDAESAEDEPAEVVVQAVMPEHGHGMNVAPRTERLGPGRYLVRGMLFHMRGRWRLTFYVRRGSVFDRVAFDLDVG